jgi:hypothetical protein
MHVRSIRQSVRIAYLNNAMRRYATLALARLARRRIRRRPLLRTLWVRPRASARQSGVEALPRGITLGHMRLGPMTECLNWFDDVPAHFREFVFHMRRRYWVHRPVHKPVPFHTAKRLGQHFRRYLLDRALQLVCAEYSMPQEMEDHDSPSIRE